MVYYYLLDMRFSQNIIILLLLFCSINALPVGNDNDYGEEAFGLSKNDNGNAVSMLEQRNLGRSGIVNKAKRWPNGTIPCFIVGPYTSREKDVLMKAINTIQYYTCIRFVPYNGEEDFIVIKHIKRIGCKSEIGRQGGRQLVIIEAPKCLLSIGRTLHALLHAIGIIDEHNRPDRDNYVKINKENMVPGKESFFDMYTAASFHDYAVPYDYNSVMHNSENSYSHEGLKTIEPKILDYQNASRMGQRSGLSVRDVIKINNMYNCYYEIHKEDKFSSVLPKRPEDDDLKDELWNTFFRNFDYK